jgi:hypothetical protein
MNVLSAILFLPIAIVTVTTGILFDENFEGPTPFVKAYLIETGTWPYALQFVSDPVYRGNTAARFEVRKNQPLVHHGKRAEVTIIKKLPGKEMWYSFAVFFPSAGFEYDSEREIINQWYQKGSPATSLRVRKDQLYLEAGATPDTRKEFNLCLLKKDVWYELVIHIIHSNQGDGLIEIWLNGKKTTIHHGGNMYAGDFPKWKIGIYKPSFKYGTSLAQNRVVYFDNIKVGDGNATYQIMRPDKD